ncbi:DUF6318 family protein [Nostocoides sp. HKS02]|uniref:DUF6318 family protein n=1 Tax=Nostocoides sp. HKS02 TaxID=1813880 RepID=UPI0012B4B9AB|nr:DUF6318 family protein [Tetrasphaera sp. HKS02]QGN58321.1 hypothetical protein GKE56_10975 [Tetrasphaera sp. HKS02]
MPVRSRTVTLVALVVAVMGSGACSEQPPANQGPQPTTTATTTTATTASSPPATPISATTTAAPVTLPPEATKHTTEGAQAFAAWFIKEADLALVTADASRLTTLTESQCKGCKVFVGWADGLHGEGRHHERPSLSIHRQIVRPESSPDRYVADLLIDEQAVSVLDSLGRVVGSEPSQKVTLRTTVSWHGSCWLVTEALLVKR